MVELLANGQIIDTASIVAGQNDEWTFTFSGLYKYEDGEEIVYWVQESAIGEMAFEEGESIIVVLGEDDAIKGSWEKSISEFEITNTWTEATDEIIYEGAEEFALVKINEESLVLAGVTFEINGEEEVTDEDGQIVVNIPVSADEKEETFEYEIAETKTLDEYKLAEGSATMVITCSSVLTDIDMDTLTNTYTKTCTIEKSGSDNYTWNEEDLTLTVVNMRKEGHGGDVPVTPETGKMTKAEDNAEASALGYEIAGAFSVLSLGVVVLIIKAAKRRKNNAK
jgi:hypothetical protein